MDRLLLLTSCGTSILTNQIDNETRTWLNGLSNDTRLTEQDQRRLDRFTKERKERFLSAEPQMQRRMSAEMNAIHAILEQFSPKQVQHILLHTDTVTGRATNDILRENLEQMGHQVQLLTAPGLRTDDNDNFRAALSDLVRDLEENWQGWRKEGWQFIFNLTGGFKSVSAYLQSYGMLRADKCVYLFEGSTNLMQIPRLPARLETPEDMQDYLEVFRRLEAGYRVTVNAQTAKIPDSLLIRIAEEVALSPWGELIWLKGRKKLLSQELLPPLSGKISFANRQDAQKAFADLSENNRFEVNKALDALGHYLDMGRKNLPKSHKLKKLSGKPKPPATHEIYASTSEGAKRIFGRLTEGGFIIDAIGDHL